MWDEEGWGLLCLWRFMSPVMGPHMGKSERMPSCFLKETSCDLTGSGHTGVQWVFAMRPHEAETGPGV